VQEYQDKTGLNHQEWIAEFRKIGASGMARKYDLNIRNIYKKRRLLEADHGTISNPNKIEQNIPAKHVRKEIDADNLVVIIGSDAHYQLNAVSTAHLAFVELTKELQPDMIILNGDMIDGASISRHPPRGWEYIPALADEMDAVQLRLEEIEKAAPSAQRIWTIGNHDSRFESRLAMQMPEMRGLTGTRLEDFFPSWSIYMSVHINFGNLQKLVVKHRWNGGVHAGYNNVLKGGVNMVTGHTHQQECKPFTDYTGTRYGVQLGTMQEPNAAAFEYAEDSPKNWVSGFAVITIRDGVLLMPEFVRVHKPGVYEFQGDLREIHD
jgi:UDP-2,3-diacylglucosamine pyrophosphatase LpxH